MAWQRLPVGAVGVRRKPTAGGTPALREPSNSRVKESGRVTTMLAYILIGLVILVAALWSWWPCGRPPFGSSGRLSLRPERISNGASRR